MKKSKVALVFVSVLVAAALTWTGCATVQDTSALRSAGKQPDVAASKNTLKTDSGAAAEKSPDKAKVRSGRPKPSYADVVYGRASGKDLLLDVYQAVSTEPAPVLVLIHGGGWMAGSKNFVAPFVFEDLASAGITLVSVGYRLTDVAIHPAQVNDCTRAVQFVRHKANEWNIDPSKIALLGASAGGHLALWVGLHDDAMKPRSKDPVEQQSSRVSCIVSYAGPTDFYLLRKIEHKHPGINLLLGVEPGTSPDKIPDALLDDVSPITYASAGDPPVLMCHGTADITVPLEHSVNLDKRLRESGVESRLLKIEGSGHGLSIKKNPDLREVPVKFLKKQLLGQPKSDVDQAAMTSPG